MAAIGGLTILAHPLLLDKWDKLVAAVDDLKAKRPDDYQTTANAKLLAALVELVTKTIPANPTLSAYRQGSTLGNERKHWFRAKFGNSRFRLFFRFHTASKVIIFAWVNDENTLRTRGSRTDAYAVFKGMLDDDNPPDDWEALRKAASDPQVVARLQGLVPPQL